MLVIAGSEDSLVSLKSCQAMASKLVNSVSIPSCYKFSAKLENTLCIKSENQKYKMDRKKTRFDTCIQFRSTKISYSILSHMIKISNAFLTIIRAEIGCHIWMWPFTP